MVLPDDEGVWMEKRTPSLPWPVQKDADGLWQGPGCFLGAVLFARRAGQVLLVRKASQPGYAFGGMWTLPGGRIRGGSDLVDAIDTTIRGRVAAEAGVTIVGGLLPLPGSPPVSRYVLHGEQRTTLVLPLTGRIEGVPAPSDTSITEAVFADPTGMWRKIAPANRVILGAALWDELDGIRRASARSALQEAWEECAMWASMRRVPPPPEPWSRS
ncbi:MAG: 8-oxo-dGTP pyrophosphatase MutT (NUDIX family) [Myxococcota bacterium]|jgi:8-oxo-dGTP pyrophosphatase MutT (NUDIX family)